MGRIYLFDWGNTLMVDFPDAQGKMCDWQTVQAVDGAKETLAALYQQGDTLYVATGADDSNVHDIQLAFERVGLAQFISGYFCKSNLGIAKGSAEFYRRIIAKLDVQPGEVTMVGDSFEKDINSALEADLHAIWFNCQALKDKGHANVKTIFKLGELSRPIIS